MTNEFWKKLAIRAEEVFCKPSVLYAWGDIVTGVMVCPPGRSPKGTEAVSTNTWRSHHRLDKSKDGSSAAYKAFFTSNRDELIEKLESTRDRQELHALANQVVSQIKGRLGNTKDKVLASYNSLRKPVDLYLMNLVAMATEIDAATRSRLIPLLYLPIDSQILDSFALPGDETFSLFTKQELRSKGLKAGSSYGHVATEGTYLDLQAIISRRASEAASASGVQYHPIYFDMLWNQRYERLGRNLFETNP